MRRRIFLVVIALMLLIGVMFARREVEFDMAGQAGETQAVTQGHVEYVTQVFNLWGFAAMFLAAYLGATALASDISGRTLLNTLSRPVRRTTYLASRWLGTLAFLWSFQALGLVVGLGFALYLDVPHTPALWLGCVARLVDVLLVSGVAMAASVFMAPVGAGLTAYLLIVGSGIARSMIHHPAWAVRELSMVTYVLAPAQMPVDLIESSFSQQLVQPPYGVYVAVLGENALYAVVAFAAACALFRRRDILIR